MTNRQTNTTSDQAALLDLRITMARKRLAWLQDRRMCEGMRQLRDISHGRGADGVGSRLVDRLDHLLAEQERKLAGMEAQRAALLLATIDAQVAEAQA